MGFNFRKSIKIGKNSRINLSKSGIGFSTGVKGARISVGPKGVRKTASIPGTGISYTEQKSWNQIKNSDKNKVSKEISAPNDPIPTTKNKKPGCGCFTVIIVLILIGILHSAFSSNTPNNVSTSNSTNNTVETKQDSKPDTTNTDNQNKTATPAIAPTDNSANNQPQNNAVQPSSQKSNSTVQSQVNTSNQNSDDNTIVYYVPGSKVYHLSKSDGTLRRSKNIQSMTLKEAKAEGMRQSASKADE